MKSESHVYRVLKRRVTVFNNVECSLKWIKISQSTYVQKPMSDEIWVIFFLYLQQMLCVIPMHVNTTFSSSHKERVLFQKFLVLLECPDRHSILVSLIPLSHWWATKTPTSLGIPALSHSTWTSVSVGSGFYLEAQSTGLYDLLTLILLIFGCGDPFGILTADLWHRGVTATSIECLSGHSRLNQEFLKE
jgi:hypothetical protein